MRSLARLCAVAFVLVACPAAPAAVTVVTKTSADVSPVALSGNGVVWVEMASNTSRLKRWEAAEGITELGTVGRVTSDSDGYYQTGTAPRKITASETLAAIESEVVDTAASKFGEPTSSRLFLVDLQNGRQSEVSCANGVNGEIVLGFPWAVTAKCNGTAVEARDARDLSVPPVQLAPSGGDIRIAGSMVSWRADGAIVIWDLAAGKEFGRLAESRLHGKLVEYDLNPRGKLVMALSANGISPGTLLSWYVPWTDELTSRTPSDPFAHLAASPNDLVAFERVGERSTLMVSTTPGVESAVARYLPARNSTNTIDFDGSHVVYTRAHCDDVELVFSRIDQSPDSQRTPKCPVTRREQLRAEMTAGAVNGRLSFVRVMRISSRKATLRFTCRRCRGPARGRRITLKPPLTVKRVSARLRRAVGVRVTRSSILEVTLRKPGAVGFWQRYIVRSGRKPTGCIQAGGKKLRPRGSCDTSVEPAPAR